MRRPIGLLAGLAVLLVSACGVVPSTGTGTRQTESREMPTFSQIEVSAGIGVTVTIGPAAPIQVTAQADVLPLVTTTVSGDVLQIALSRAVLTDAIDVVVVTPTLDGISLSGGSHLDVGPLQVGALGVTLSGGSRVGALAPGTVGSLDLEASGGSRADLAALTAEVANVEASGGSTVAITATDAVNGSASGGSHVSVKGEATVDVEATGGASVTHD